MKYLKVTLFTFNALIWLAGCALLALGAWLLVDPSKDHIFNLFTSDIESHKFIYVVSCTLLGFGSIVLSMGFFGCRAALRGNQCTLVSYMGMMVTLIIGELSTVALGGFVTFRVLSSLEERLTSKLAVDYGHDPSSDIPFSHSLDFAQYKNKNTGSPMSVVSRVFHKDNEKPWLRPQPKDESACQVKDEEGHEGYRHKEGCLAKVTNWFQCESFTLVFLGMALAGIQTFGIITSAFLCRTVRDMEEE
ncbi:tetraspanin-2-like isoform X2 [Linepithema humile]|uniref:tetraspanin-2-like isoform X2 n=1 Tax=Linepithema humile TaxID=83485 RepID=UPI00351ED65C